MEQSIRFCTTPDGVRLAYATLGSGSVLIKAGNPLTHLAYDRHSPVWRHWWEGLAQHHTFIRYDERGCGLSDWHVDEFSIDAWVSDLETVVNQTGAKRFALLGISQGASVAIAYTVRHPEQVSHLILYGGYMRGRFHRNTSPEHQAESRMLIDLIRHGWGKDNPAFRQVFAMLFLPEGTIEQTHWLNDLARITSSSENAAKMEEAFYQINVMDLAPQITVPTLVLHAQEDAMCSFEEGRLMATLIPNAKFVPLQSKNHILLEHEPAWAKFLHEIDQFLNSQSEIGLQNVNSSAHQPEASISSPLRLGKQLELTEKLTDREQEILNLIAQGLSNSQIGERCVLSPKTVRNHITHIFSKMQVTTRAEAIVRAREAGFGS